MRILTIADKECRALWDYYQPGTLKGVDLILSCGDLPSSYLSYITCFSSAPLVYVHGNHDHQYNVKPPEGCINAEGHVVQACGLRILGLGGSMRYKNSPCMYTEAEMQARIRKAGWQIRLMGGFDILLTHAPAKGCGDMEDLPHRGFACFNTLLETWKPAYMVHGHVHREYAGASFARIMKHPAGTSIVNACERYTLELGEQDYPPPGQTGSPLYDLWFRVQQGRKRNG